MKRLLLTLCALCATTALWAATWTDPETGIEWTYSVSNSKATIGTGGYQSPAVPSSTSGSITIPSKIDEYLVTSIGYEAFFGCSGLTSITIPSSVTSIGEYAFYYCLGLTSVTIPSSVTSIGDYAFYYCTGLTSVTISEGVTSIGECAFYYCSKLKIVVDENNPNYTSQDGALFNKEMTTLIRGPGATASYTIPSSVTSIGDRAFYDCSGLPKDANGVQYESANKVVLIDVPTSLTGEFVIPDSVRFIHSDAFYNCSGLTSVTIPEGVTSIGNYAFRGCSSLPKDANGVQYESENKVVLIDVPTSLRGEFVVPDSVRFIHSDAFFGCTDLTSVTIPPSVTSIGDSAFYYCSGLTSVTIPSSVTSIGEYAFRNCSGLTSVTIPEGVTSIGDRAFDGCSGLAFVTIPSSVTSIGQYAFDGCSGLTSITIPEGVTSIGDSAFRNCSGLTSITIPSSVTSIGNRAFGGCSKLKIVVDGDNPNYASQDGALLNKALTTLIRGPGSTAVYTIPSSVTSIGDWAFGGCSGLTSVTIPSSVTSIGEYAFYYCLGLTSVTIPSSVTSIGDYAFYYCTGLTSVTIPSSVTSIGDYAFYYCTGLTSVTISEGVTSIGDGAFSECSRLTSVTISEGVSSIGEHAFSWCTGLTSVTISEGVTSIGRWAFYYCSGLTSVTISEGVTSIGHAAFHGCSSLSSVEFLGVPPSVGGGAFYNVTATGTYLSDYASEWEAVISNGKWNGLTMQMVEGGGDEPEVFELTYSVTSSGVVITGFTGSCPAELVIPETIEDIPVTAIGEAAFSGCSGMTSVTIPKSVMAIGADAFKDCTGLTGVYITDVGVWCLTEFANPYANPLYYAHKLYVNGVLLEHLVVPEEATVIKYGAFYGCTSLKSVTVPDTVTSIGGDAFYGCSGMTSVSFSGGGSGGGVAYIGGGAFTGCSGLTSVTLPDTVTSMGDKVFEDCTGLTTMEFTIDVEVITDYAFYNCTSLKSVTIPGTVKRIGKQTFYGCTNLELVTFLGEPPATVGDEAFPETVGAFQKKDAVAWTAVIDASGKWHNLDFTGSLKFTVIFDANGGVGSKSETLQYGAALTAPTVSRVGYSFLGWSPEVPSTVPAGDTTYTAQWKINQYTATFNANGGEGGKTVTQDYGSALVAPTVTRVGHTFTGWSPAVPSTVPAANTTYTAQWQVNQYTVIFDANGGEGGTSTKLSYGAALTAPTVTREGYTFTGWEPAVPATVPAANVTYTAQWEMNSYLRYTVTATGVIITGLNSGYPAEVVIPSMIEEKPVVSIAGVAFADCTGLVSVTLPETLTTIGGGAFSGCTGLTSVTIPVGVTSIGNYGFENCSALTSITVPSTVTSIGYATFSGCTGLTSIMLSEGLKTIGDYAFYRCVSLPSITTPAGVTTIGTAAFSGCSALKTVVLSEGITTLGEQLFYNCVNLSSITIPASVTSIGDNAFYSCSKVKFTVVEGSQTYASSDGGLYNKSMTTLLRGPGETASYVVPEGVLSIGSAAFNESETLTSITLPSTLTSIAYAAFFKCSALTSVTIPASVTTIDGYAFAYCSGLKTVSLSEGLASIGEAAFAYCSTLSAVSLPATLASMDESAFAYCVSLTSVTLADGLQALGNYAFYGCSSLTSVTIPEGCSIGYAAFSDCMSLSSVTIADGVASIGEYAFSKCPSLAEVVFLGEPPTLVQHGAFPETNGTYRYEHITAWRAVMDENGKWHNLTMTCANPPKFEVTVTAVGGGAVSGGGFYTWGDWVTVTATAPEGYIFCGWDASSVTSATAEADCTFIMPEHTLHLTAYFAPKSVMDAYASKNDLISRDEVKEMAFDTPLVEVGADAIEIAISLQTAESLNAWEAMALEGATLEVDQEAGLVRVRVPKGEKKAAFYKFVVPTNQSK